MSHYCEFMVEGEYPCDEPASIWEPAAGPCFPIPVGYKRGKWYCAHHYDVFHRGLDDLLHF
jgi:hypothetical protein